LLLPMMLCLALTLGTGCQSTKGTPEQIEIPAFSAVKPTAPELVGIPSDADGAIKALATDLSRLDGYTRQLEEYITEQENYYQTVMKIINR